MNNEVIITCALTGAGDTVGKSEHVPVTPEQIAASAIEAANAGAAVVHVHVRDVETGQGSRDVALYREVCAAFASPEWTLYSTSPPGWAVTSCSTRRTRSSPSTAPTW